MTDIQASAPGRVNLIGEHTDYNGGYVLPAAIPQETVVRLTPRNDRLVNARSLEMPPELLMTFEVGHEHVRHSWIDYVQGVTWALAELRLEIQGFDLIVSSTVPIGKGLSSSASLEVATARALNAAFELGLTDMDIALLCHRAEIGVCRSARRAHGSRGVQSGRFDPRPVSRYVKAQLRARGASTGSRAGHCRFGHFTCARHRGIRHAETRVR